MHRIDGPGATIDNRFTDGDPVGGVQATLVTDDWLNDIQENIMAVLAAAGVIPAKGQATDLIGAINKLIPKVATSPQMAAGTDASLVPSVAAVMSLFAKRSFAKNDYIRIPDVPGGLVINWGSAQVNAAGDINVNYPLAYSTLEAITLAVSGQNTDAAYLSNASILGGFTMPFYKTTTGAKSSGGFNAQWISIGR